MNTKKNYFTKIMSFTLVMVMLLSVLSGVIPYVFAATTYDTPAAGDQAIISTGARIYRSDTGAKYVMANGLHDMRNFKFVPQSGSKNYNPNTQLYCIQYGAPLPADSKYEAITPAEFDYWVDFVEIQQEGMLLSIAFGYPSSTKEALEAPTADDAIAATQALVWEFMTGSRFSFEGYPYNTLIYNEYIKDTPAYDAYWNILEMANEYYSDPRYNYDELMEKSEFVIWEREGYQSLISYTLPDSGPAPKPDWEDTGWIRVFKTDPDGKPLAGAGFTVTDENGNYVTTIGPTDSNGLAISNDVLPFGKYTVTETTFPDGYEGGLTTLEVELDAYAPGGICTVRFINVQQVGTASIIKVTESMMPIEGVKFGVYADAECKELMQVITTRNDGVASSGLIPAGITVYLKEIEPKDNTYITDNTIYPVTIRNGTYTLANDGNPVVNYQKHWQLTVNKEDALTHNQGAGDANVAGAVYGLYDSNGTLLEECVIGNAGSFTTEKYLAGLGYYLKEISAPAGYLIDTQTYSLDQYAMPQRLSTRLTKSTLTVGETVATGTISIKKFTEDPSHPGEFNVPEAGAKFCIYLKSAGSYDEAVAHQDARIYDIGVVNDNGNVVWSNGSTISKELAYGTYIVHQISSWEDREMVTDFEVTISQNKQHAEFTLQNLYNKASIVINKKDSESGKLITNSSAVFVVKNATTGEYVTFTDASSGQTVTELHTVNGIIKLPASLPYGTYEIVEVKAPQGYYPSEEAISFTVNETNRGTLTFNVYNKPLKGVIAIEKTGLQFVAIEQNESEHGTISKPVFESKYLAGAKFNVIAAEPIVTGDGTVHYKKGDVVETITTAADGAVRTSALYLGKYELVEIEAPNGYILNSRPIPVTVENDGKQELTAIKVNTENERVSTQITLKKNAAFWKAESDGSIVDRTIIMLPGKDFVFGIYADQDFIALDGSVIMKDALVSIAVTDAEGKLAFTENLPHGLFYVKELAAPSTHEYVLSEAKYAADLRVTNTNATCISVDVNNGDAINNEFKYTPVTITKLDSETGAPVAGALIVVKDDNGDIVYKLYTKADGTLSVLLEEGSYTYQEVSAPEGYELNSNIFSINISESGAVNGTISFTNTPVAAPDPILPPAESEPPTEPSAPTEPEKPEDNAPQTGDKTPVLMLALVCLVAVAAAAMLISKKFDKALKVAE